MLLSILLTIVHVGVAVFLIMVVLLQTGKRADLAGAFGGGGSQTAFGTRGAATLLSKLTTASAVIFMLTSLSLSLLSSGGGSQGGRSVLPDEPATPAQTQQAPAEQPQAGQPPAEQPQAPPVPTAPTDDTSQEPATDEPANPDSGESPVDPG